MSDTITVQVQEVPRANRARHKCLPSRNSSRSDYAAFGICGVCYEDAMKSVADLKQELLLRLKGIDSFLVMSEEEFYQSDSVKGLHGIEKLEEIRGRFSGELEFACKGFGLPVYDVCEKAAIYEFDAGYSRRRAELMALRDFMQHAGRYDGKAKDLIESGEILDLARRCIDEMDAIRHGREMHPLYGRLA